MKQLLGLPIGVAEQKLREKGIPYSVCLTEEPKKSLQETRNRVVRVRRDETGVQLTISGFVTEVKE